MSLCHECKKDILNAPPGANVCIQICDKCTIEDIYEFLEKERNLKAVLAMKNHYDVAVKLDKESEERLKKIREQIAQKDLSDCMKEYFQDPLQIKEYDSTPEGLMKRFRHHLRILERLLVDGKVDQIADARNQLVEMVSSLFWWKEGESSMENAPKDSTPILVELEEYAGFDVASYHDGSWFDRSGNPIPLEPIRWWILPEKQKKKHMCKCPNHPIKCFTNDIGGLNLMSTHDKVSYVTQVNFCPFCGEKA